MTVNNFEIPSIFENCYTGRLVCTTHRFRANAPAPVMSIKTSIASTVRDQLRTAILKGELAPRQRLRLEELGASYRVSLSPVREALLRLMGERLVVGEDQRGFAVAETSLANLDEVMALRMLLEPHALRLAMASGGIDWEERLVALAHRLRRIEAEVAAPLALDEWEQAHREFHLALLSACGMPLLMDFCSMLYDLADRYRRLYLARHPPQRDVGAEHEEILRLAVARDPAACDLLHEHVRRTGVVVAAFMRECAPLSAQPGSPSAP